MVTNCHGKKKQHDLEEIFLLPIKMERPYDFFIKMMSTNRVFIQLKKHSEQWVVLIQKQDPTEVYALHCLNQEKYKRHL